MSLRSLAMKLFTLLFLTLFMVAPVYLYTYIILQENCFGSNDKVCVDFYQNNALYSKAAYYISWILLVLVMISYFMNVYKIGLKK
jgi:hypothetical protein